MSFLLEKFVFELGSNIRVRMRLISFKTVRPSGTNLHLVIGPVATNLPTDPSF